MVKMKFFRLELFSIAFTLLFSALSYGQSPVFYEDSVASIFRKNCIACHNAKLAEGGLNMETVASIRTGGDSGPAFDAKEISQSLILTRPTEEGESAMPPKDNKVGAERLSSEQLQMIKVWVSGGALSKDLAMSPSTALQAKLPESARASYAAAVAPNSDFLAYGRGGQLVIHPFSKTSLEKPIAGLLDEKPSQVISDAHRDFIYSVAVSSDGKTIATGSSGQVKIWRQAENSIDATVKTLETLGISPSSLLSVSTDGVRMACVDSRESASTDVKTNENNGDNTDNANPSRTELRILNRDGTLLHSLAVPEANLLCGGWSPSNNRFYAVGRSLSLYSWDLVSQPPSQSIAKDILGKDLHGNIQSIVALDEDKLLIVHDRKLSVVEQNVAEGKTAVIDHPIVKPMNDSGPVDMIAVSNDRRVIAAATKDEGTGNCTIQLWDVATAKRIGTIDRDRSEQFAVFVSDREVRRSQAIIERANGVVADLEKSLKLEVTATTDATAAKEKASQEFSAKEEAMKNAAMALVDHEKAMADTKAAIEVATQKLATLTSELESKKKLLAETEKQKQDAQKVMAMAVQNAEATEESKKGAESRLNEHKLFVAKQSDRLATIKSSNEQRKASSGAVRFSVDAMVFAENNLLAAIGKSGTEPTLDLFSAETLERVSSRKISGAISSQPALAAVAIGHTREQWIQSLQLDSPSMLSDRVTALAFSPDCSRLAIGSGMSSRSGQLAIVNLSDQTIVKSFEELHSDSIFSLAYSPDSHFLATCGADKMIKLIDTQTNEVVKILEGHTHHVLSVAWHDEGHRLASASADSTVKIWDIERGESIRTISGYNTEITGVAFVGSTSNIVASTLQNVVQLHDSNSGKQLKQFSPAGDSLYAVAVSPNGKYTVATGQEGVMRVWHIEDGRLVAEWK